MSKRFALLAGAAIIAFAAAAAPAPLLAQMSEKTVTVGGAPMYPSKNIIQTRSTPRITPRWWPR